MSASMEEQVFSGDLGPERGPHLEARPFRPFKTSEEYLYAMREDLAEWLNMLYDLDITAESFMERLDTGVVLCQHANSLRRCADRFQTDYRERHGRPFCCDFSVPEWQIAFNSAAGAGSFFARDNVHNFIGWSRQLGVLDCLLFETEDLVSRKNEKHVILCLLEIARRGAKFGMAAPMLVQFEQQIDRELAREQDSLQEGSWGDETLQERPEEPTPLLVYASGRQLVTNDLKSLDEMVRDLVERCTCPSQFPMIRVSEGKYRIGDTKTLIFVRVLRKHVMVRVGGGWDTLQHFLDKHDPCRCKSGHRSTVSSKLTMKTINHTDGRQLHSVAYERLEDAPEVSIEQGECKTTPGFKKCRPLSPNLRSDPGPAAGSPSESGSPGARYLSPASCRPEQRSPGRTGRSPPDSAARGLKGRRVSRSSSRGEPRPRPAVRCPSADERAAPPISQLCAMAPSTHQSGSSVRLNRAAASRLATADRIRSGTWSGGEMRSRQRAPVTVDTFRAPPRAPSASPDPRRRRLAQTPRETGVLADLLRDEEALQSDSGLLRRMQLLLRRYRCQPTAELLTPRVVTPRKDSHSPAATRSRIPGPTFFQQPPQTEACP